ncbi:membrane protein [Rhizobium mesoamericanum]|uniref:membrane protein n=1 Tax=Rhizobium mesoamericanum TaxID=1079800 RepID=UPI00048EC13F|nr:membrane protein [Rhizobium mesoamericanum]
MSADQGSTTDISALSEPQRQALRVALAVSMGFTAAAAVGAVLPFIGPLFAAQFLLSSSRPLPLAQTIGMVVLILATSSLLIFLTGALIDRPIVFLTVLGFIYFCCFAVQAIGRGGPAVFLVLVVAVIIPLVGVLHATFADSVLSILLGGVLSATALMWLAHALVPEPTVLTAAPQREIAHHEQPVRRACANTLILLFAVAFCIANNQLVAAVVIPITVVSLLDQLDIAASGRAAIGIVAVNVFGGILASIAYGLLSMRPSLALMFAILLIVALGLGTRAASRSSDAKLYSGALTIFLILFGLGVSPLPGTAAESLSTRITYVAAAIIYTVVVAAVLWPQPALRSARGQSVENHIEEEPK